MKLRFRVLNSVDQILSRHKTHDAAAKEIRHLKRHALPINETTGKKTEFFIEILPKD